jgi:hypothetical protein
MSLWGRSLEHETMENEDLAKVVRKEAGVGGGPWAPLGFRDAAPWVSVACCAGDRGGTIVRTRRRDARYHQCRNALAKTTRRVGAGPHPVSPGLGKSTLLLKPADQAAVRWN